MNYLGIKIQEIRKIRKMTQDDLAFEMHTTRQIVNKWENGEVEPELKQIQAISKILRVSVDFLLDDERTMEQVKTRKITGEAVKYRSNLSDDLKRETSDSYRTVESNSFSHSTKNKKISKFGIFILVLGVMCFLINWLITPLAFFSMTSSDFGVEGFFITSTILAMTPILGVVLILVGSIIVIVSVFKTPNESKKNSDIKYKKCRYCGERVKSSMNTCPACGMQLVKTMSF